MTFKQLILLTSVVSMSLSTVDGYHVFTDSKGRKLAGEIIDYYEINNTVKVKKAGESIHTVPISTFSKADQKYIISWNRNRNFLSDRRLKVDVNRFKDKVTGASAIYHDHSFKIKFTNSSNTGLNNIRIEYCIFYSQEYHVGRGYTKKMEKCGILYDEKTIRIPSKSDKEFVTEKLCLLTSRYISNNPNSAKKKNLYSDVDGIIIKMSMTTDTGGVVTRMVKYPAPLKHEWMPKTTNAQPRPPSR